MTRPWWPFVERYPGTQLSSGGPMAPPHWRVYRLVYTRYLDWTIIRPSKVKHLFWRFWWVGR